MKLIIKRNQADQKGIFGGHKGVSFTLYSKAELTQNERVLIERYKVGDHVLAEYSVQPKGAVRPTEYTITVNNLANGTTGTAGSIGTLLDLENAIKDGCLHLKTLLQVMSTFGGEEVVEI